MTDTTTLVIEMPRETRDQLASLAQSTGRSEALLSLEAIQRYLEIEAWHTREIEDAVREADAGDFASDDEVATTFARWSTPSQSRA